MKYAHSDSLNSGLTVLAVAGALALAGGMAQASPIRTASGSYGGFTWQARSVIVGTTSTSTLAGGGNPIYFATMPQYSGTVALIMNYGTSSFICSGTLLPDRRSILTAAHCVSDDTGARPVSTVAWFYGGYDPDTIVPNNALSTSVAVSNYFVHAGYSGEVIDHNDIAVLRLATEAPAFATSFGLYDGGLDGTLTGENVNLAGYGARSDTGGSVGANLGIGRLRQGNNNYAFRFGDPDWLGFFVAPGFFGPMAEFSYVVDFDNGSTTNDASCQLAGALGLGGAKYCNHGLGNLESMIAGGDSGGPNFIGGKVSGVNSYSLSFGEDYGDIDGSLNSSFGEFGGFVPVYRHLTFISDHMLPSSLASLSLSNSIAAGCKSVTGTVTLSGPAPAAGVVVTLSDTLASASVPETLTILAGATAKTFTVKTVPVVTNEIGTVSATLGSNSLSQPLAVRTIGLTSVTLTPNSVVGGNAVVGKATLECNAGPNAILVDLASSNAAAATPVAANISIPQGAKTGLFDVATSAVMAKATASISGAANGIKKSKTLTINVAAGVAPTSLKFGGVPVGTTSTAQNVILTNKGAVPFSVNSIGLTGTASSWFAQTNDCPATLAAGASCFVSVTFTPLSAASKSAKLSITTSATSTPLSVSLSGAGVLPP